ncbi:group-specific protein [Fredinandcohnia quinoae]|uniref:Group-specific protein n=1 Tax=Fredinandcohnia quinoae TaxID=2918902 RepID=A0AAW5DTK9_9BACI|nr:group-specific protein [Fredinandcohnia sp. SECRCQ15]MCH1623987.1 group-specific protein [Fredinandcohnia sp. SECRCQ15]
MSICNLDHSKEDVNKKLASQENFLPQGIYEDILSYLEKERSQKDLNELFHLLKKYDLATKEEQSKRNELIRSLIN